MSSAAQYDAIVIGAGSNGLVAAAALGKAGKRVLLVESADAMGGQRRVSDFAPGFRAPLIVDTGWLPPTVARGLGITSLGTTAPRVVASVAGDGQGLSLSADANRAATTIRGFSNQSSSKS